MARLARVFQKQFGSTAVLGEIGIFGSFAAGSPDTSTGPVSIQSLAQFLGGWSDAVVGGNSPAIEDMNALFYLLFYQFTYLLQAGVPEWDTDTEYFLNNIVASDGIIYVSLTDNNTGNAVTDASNWKTVGDQVISTVTTLTTFSALSGQFSDAQNIVLPPGTWDISAGLQWFRNNSDVFNISMGIGTASGLSGAGLISGVNRLSSQPPTAIDPLSSITIPPYRVTITVPTTFYQKLSCGFTTGQPQFQGVLSAVRIH